MPAENNFFDAIVVGTGISGGWAAKELTEKGLKTLVLDRGRMVKHGEYPTALEQIWELPYAGRPTQDDLQHQMVTQRAGVLTQANKHWFVNDTDYPYIEKKPFGWVRGYHVGGRSIMWGRQSYRWSPMDFEANAKEDIAVDWPIRYEDLAPWYDRAESFIGVSGQAEGYAQLPDGKFLPPMALNCVEMHLKEAIASKMGRAMTIGRTANLTAPLAHSPQRGTCQYRNLCVRGCPFGAYFSSNSSTLPAAEKTGNMTLRPNSIVYELIHDAKNDRASGVRVLDAETNQQMEFHAKVIFLCASTFGSTSILMNSVSSRFPEGFGNDSGELGCNIMDHHLGIGATAQVEGFDDQYYSGQRPNGIYIPRFVNIGKDKRSYLRGFGYQGGAGRSGWTRLMEDPTLGADLKTKAAQPGPWGMRLVGFGETLPYHDNRVVFDRTRKDKHGLPVLEFDAGMRENETRMRKDMAAEAATMLDAAGFKNVREYDNADDLGMGIHEMGTARMGRDPKTSVLNAWNQVHACKNVYVTDGSCMTSSACQNPSLTYMALTSRAADHAVQELKRMNL
ncbi:MULTISPECIES: GMC family oxidoreductase [unclassified Lysobacter]|uniref:GMC oxidoreductase n=1 Tax=unclassified Lysobacter TaxID=2635362 RepID=UPI001BE8CE47|nr:MULTISPECIES: GMC family oxidoreductase [unclassified Lysobacter]MBT2744914.1 GMC family oxidoreductase [Lysobacter sp. ISL-42]MBT2752093.1 GMC family oxidoreductase [Lysobacter sp. ISL-50]MBT2778590.1 GMC family oxidoreductase [Lysobacter sp. ISL-54]MBT2780479.1 GMC family oxidoreductase [Lysobacter sp. ISL-52]